MERARVQTFQVNREEVVVACQRDRKRLRWVLGMAKGLRDWIAANWYGAGWYLGLDNARRWSAAWKAAAKWWRRTAGTHELRGQVRKLERARNDLRRQTKVLRLTIDNLEYLGAEKTVDSLNTRIEELQRRLEVAADILEEMFDYLPISSGDVYERMKAVLREKGE